MTAYLVAQAEVTNFTEDFKRYAERSAEILHDHGGKYIVRGLPAKVLKGEQFKGKFIIIAEFPSMEHLDGFLNDEEYVNEVAPLREGTGNYEFAACESPPPDMV